MVGAPVVFTVQQLVSTTLVAGQPPAHSDWLNGAFQNVSRNQDFYVQLGNSSTSSYTSSNEQTSSTNYGVSASAQTTETVTEGIPDIDGGSESVGVKASLGFKWGSSSDSTASSTSTQTTSVTQATQDDDIVNGQIQNLSVYRYPVLSRAGYHTTSSASCAAGCYGYWDVVIPGSIDPVSGSGKSFDWYQPEWQNGNALSYPQISATGGPVPTPDLGTYQPLDAGGNPLGPPVTSPLANQLIDIGGTTYAQSIGLTNGTSSSDAESTNLAWNASLQVTAGIKAAVGIPGEAVGQSDTTLSAGFNTDSSFTGTTTSSNTSSHTSSFKVNVPEVDANKGYQFGLAYYYSQSGTPEVGYAVNLDNGADGSEWWLQNYGQQSDPALNLAYSTVLTYDDNLPNYLGQTMWNGLSDRQQIRGFSARHPLDPSSPVTSGAIYAGAPQVGDPVVFDVDVHNDSLISTPSPVTVDFYAVPVDALGLNVTGAPVPIGQSTVGTLGPQSVATVSSPQWTAAGTAAGGSQNWRVFVVLDKNNSIPEVHEWAGNGSDTCPASSIDSASSANGLLTDPMTGQTETLACGQNNQGYATINVQAAPPATTDAASSTAGAATAQTAATASVRSTAVAGVHLTGAGAVTSSPEDLVLDENSAVPTLTQNQRSTLLVRAGSDTDSADYQHVLVYDGSPQEGKLIASTTMQGVRADGQSTASFAYTPTTTGVHELHEVILGTDTAGGNDEQIVRVNVVAGGGGSGAGSGSAGGGASAGDTSTGAAHPASSAHALAATGDQSALWFLVAGVTLVLGGVLLRVVRRRRRAS
ncbi:MAG: hypothetical protein JWQ19_2506 [Subtercola sp.]|nr:hypothetical protein [Subtercola sp.]